MKSMPIITKIESLNLVHGWVYSANKTDCHDIAEILLIVALNTITLTLTTKVESSNLAHGLQMK
jgi:hypothetical protein